MRTNLITWTLSLGALCLGSVAVAQTSVDLRQWQTPLQSQGARTSCIVFSAVAALEARYKRLGLSYDLSEEFVNYMSKLFWLEPNWTQIANQGSNRRENQMGWTGGGNGGGMLEWLCSGLAAPLEQYLTYQPTLSGTHPWNDPHWDSQWNANTWNLDPANLPRSALRAPAYYYGTGFHWISQPTSAAAIESALQNGYEVVWDFFVLGDRPTGGIWHASTASGGGGHSMLIVGYDRTHQDPSQHYFIVKNSWGGNGAMPSGYTHIGYDYLQYGYSAAYLTGASYSGRSWPELQLLGRRNICFDGWRGTLDIHHLPGISQLWMNQYANGIADRRVGTFFDQSGVAHRVNGMVYGKTVHFWFKGAPNDNMCYDEQRETPTVGRSFVYTIVDGNDAAELAGRHHDNPGPVPTTAFGGYARAPSTMLANDGFLQPVFDTNQPWQPEQFLGAWRLQTGGYWFYVRLAYRDDQVVPVAQQATHYGLVGHVMLSPSSVMPITALVDRAGSRNLQLEFTHPAVGLVRIDGWMLNWQRGVVGGLAEVALSPYEAFYMVRQSDYTPGAIVEYGSACGPANYQPYHRVTGFPEVGQNLHYEALNLPANGVSFLSLGLQNQTFGSQQLPLPLGSYGMPGCYLFTNPIWTMFLAGNGQGVASLSQQFAPGLRGAMTHSQYFVLVPGANAANLLSSNAVAVALGGAY